MDRLGCDMKYCLFIFHRPLRDDEKLPVRTHRIVSDIAQPGEVEEVKGKKKHRKEKESKKDRKKKKRDEKKEEKVSICCRSRLCPRLCCRSRFEVQSILSNCV